MGTRELTLNAETTSELCERAERACREARELLRQMSETVATAKGTADELRRRLDDWGKVSHGRN